jgi:predicted MFS family arabinose efflux permease
MQHSGEAERAGASALNFLVLLSGQAIGAALAGVGIRWFGYATVLLMAAVMAVAAALCFRKALGGAVGGHTAVVAGLPEPAE